MGYSHYFKQTDIPTVPQWNAFLEGVKKLVSASPVKLAGGLGEAGTLPEITEDTICFNGLGPEDDHETFWLMRDSSPERREWDEGKFPFNFCKTARKPYDLIVCAVLIAADFHLPGCYEIASDGSRNNPEEWFPALRFVEEVLGETKGFEIPEGVESDSRYPSNPEDVKRFQVAFPVISTASFSVFAESEAEAIEKARQEARYFDPSQLYDAQIDTTEGAAEITEI